MVKVISAYLHDALQVRGFSSEKTISQAKFPGASFHRDNHFLFIDNKGRRATVPITNVSSMEEELSVDVSHETIATDMPPKRDRRFKINQE